MLERGARRVHLFARGERGKKAEEAAVVSLDDDRLEALIGDGELHAQLIDDVEMLDGLTDPLDLDRLKRGEQTPVLFGSAMTNFGAQRSWRGGGGLLGCESRVPRVHAANSSGVQLLLDTLMSLGSPPTPRALDAGDEAGFTSGELTGDPLLRHCHGRDTAETWPRDGRDTAETWPRDGRDMAETWPRHGT